MKIWDKNGYHFIGIGGIGVSAIAKMLILQGKKVSGSDVARSEITDDLERTGIKIIIGQNVENIPTDAEVVIYSVAIPVDNPEMTEAKKREARGNLACVSYPEALGHLSKNMTTIAVAGTHGKTTTTAMIGHILQKAGLDPTIIVGSKMLEENSNFHAGRSKYLVVEACEYKRSFLNLFPQILVITNIEADHLDYYKNLEDIQSAFREIARKVPKDGFVVARAGEESVKKVIRKLGSNVLDYDSVNIRGAIGVSGEHNILNAKAAVKTASALGVEEREAIKYLGDFKGTWRRLEYKGEKDGNVFYDDYAHHPTEIRASLSTLKQKYPGRELICIFEPHQQSRTRTFFNDFVEALRIADRVFVAPIFITREKDDKKTTNKTLAEAVSSGGVSAFPIESEKKLQAALKHLDSRKPLCIVLMGAGNIYTWTRKFLN